MDIFNAFRQAPGPTLYRARSLSPVDYDVQQLTLYFIIAALIVFSIFGVFGGINIAEQFKKIILLLVAVFIGSSIVLCTTSIEWKQSTVNSKVQYRSYSGDAYNVTLELYIGLKTFNITMKEADGIFTYNEEFMIDKAYNQRAAKKEAIRRGLPLAIVALTECLAEDKAGFTWGRRYRLAGQYTYLFMWVSFGMWLLACLQFIVCIKSASITTLLTGVVQLMAIVIYVGLQPPRMIVPFPDAVLTLYQWRFGYAFWWTVGTGFLCLALGIFLTTVTYLFPGLFGLDKDVKCDRYDDSQEDSQFELKGHQDLWNLNDNDLQKLDRKTPVEIMNYSIDGSVASSRTSSRQDGRHSMGYNNFSYIQDSVDEPSCSGRSSRQELQKSNKSKEQYDDNDIFYRPKRSESSLFPEISYLWKN